MYIFFRYKRANISYQRNRPETQWPSVRDGAGRSVAGARGGYISSPVRVASESSGNARYITRTCVYKRLPCIFYIFNIKDGDEISFWDSYIRRAPLSGSYGHQIKITTTTAEADVNKRKARTPSRTVLFLIRNRVNDADGAARTIFRLRFSKRLAHLYRRA